MTTLTRLLLLLTVLALLPLGSFSAEFGTGPRALAVISAQLDDAAVAAAPPEKTFAAAQSRCNGPALPGSPCNPALAVWPTAATLGFPVRGRKIDPVSWPAKIAHEPALPLGPPRLA